ncbi:MAG TPA: alkaline phosphatase family protein [Candidatus Eisenbacteria bacterium]|nr:alkaline phosphatase family protein [Candidatus Eisenbacteria bacterium]
MPRIPNSLRHLPMPFARGDQPVFPRLCAAVLGVAMAHAAFSYESSLNIDRPAVLNVRPAPRSHAHGPATRVVWIMIDGLRLDLSREMPSLNRLRAEGEDVSARSEFPTFSGPNLVAQASGIEPAASGILSNGFPDEVALDSVFRRAKLAGLRTAIMTTDPDYTLAATYASWVDETRVSDQELEPPPGAQLVLAHAAYVDWAAHDYGVRAPEFRAALTRADDMIGRIAASIDPSHEALIVTSDHGNLDEGGHGGTEREVMRIPIVVWGAGAVHRTQAGRSRDVGPTIASLLGIGPLSHATGRSLVHGSSAAARQRDAARAAIRAEGRTQVDHVPMAIPLAVLVFLLLSRTAWPGMRPLIGSTTYTIVFAGLMAVTGTASFSMSNNSALFGLRLTTMCLLAGFAQLLVGGRSSLVTASLVASMATLATATVAARQPLAPIDGMLRFLPIPAITALAFVCLMTAGAGLWHRLPAAGPIRDEAEERANAGEPAGEPSSGWVEPGSEAHIDRTA